MQRTRRSVLAASVTLLTAGCLETGSTPTEGAPGGQNGEATTTDTEATATGTEEVSTGTEETVTGTDGCHSGTTLRTAPFDPVSDLPVDLDEEERSIVETARSEGTAEYVTYGTEPLRSGVIVRHEGAFYRTDFSRSIEAVPAYTLDLYWEDGQTAPDDATVVPFEDLPAPDRTVLETAALGDGEEGEGDGLPQRTLSIREYPAPYPDDATNSQLVGNRTWVRWRDRTMRVDVAGESDSTTERRTFHYTLEQIAEGDAAFRAFAADQYVVTLDGLSASERSILSEAIADRYEECRPDSDALAAIRERLTDADALPHPRNDSWYVEFEGERYRVQITQWAH